MTPILSLMSHHISILPKYRVCSRPIAPLPSVSQPKDEGPKDETKLLPGELLVLACVLFFINTPEDDDDDDAAAAVYGRSLSWIQRSERVVCVDFPVKRNPVDCISIASASRSECVPT